MKPIDIIQEQNTLLKGGPGSGPKQGLSKQEAKISRENTRGEIDSHKEDLNELKDKLNDSDSKIDKLKDKQEESYSSKRQDELNSSIKENRKINDELSSLERTIARKTKLLQ